MAKYFVSSILLLFSSVAMSGDVTGKINVVSPHTHPAWKGVMIQMADGKIVDANCGNSTWALIKVENELDKILVSVVLTAKTTQETVRVFTSECSTSSATGGTVPIVQNIDFGIREQNITSAFKSDRPPQCSFVAGATSLT